MWALLAILSLLVDLSCPVEAFAMKEDVLSLLSQVSGGGGVNETIEVFRHFAKFPDLGSSENNYFLERQFEQEKRNLSKKKTRETLPLAWVLGFNYSRFAVQSIGDNSLNFKMGLDWQMTHPLTGNIILGLGMIPEESYSHGSAAMHFEYFFPISVKHPQTSKPSRASKKFETEDSILQNEIEDEPEPLTKKNENDASLFYREERERKLSRLDQEFRREIASLEDTEIPSTNRRVRDDHYPNIKVAYHLLFENHQFSTSKVFTRTSGQPSLGQAVTMFQYRNGPEVSYSPNDRWTFSLSADFASYNKNVSTILSLFELGYVIQVMGAVGDVNQFLTFPSNDYSGSIDFYLDDANSLTWGGHYTLYALAGQQATLSMTSMYYRELGKTWRLGIGADILMNTGTNAVLPMTFLGSLQVTYKFH